MRLLPVCAALGIVLVLALPAASAAELSTPKPIFGAANYYTYGYVVVGWKEFVGGTAYGLPTEEQEAYVIVKICSTWGSSAVPEFCVREDLVAVASETLLP